MSYTYIQGAASAATIAATTQTAEFGSAPQVGDLVVAGVQTYQTPGTITITDNDSNTWTSIDPATHGWEYAYLYALTLTSVGSGFTVDGDLRERRGVVDRTAGSPPIGRDPGPRRRMTGPGVRARRWRRARSRPPAPRTS